MPMQRDRYPADWEQISRRIRFERAHSKCEWCGAPNGQYIVRDRQNPGAYWVPANGMEVASAQERGEWVVFIVLTTAHLPEATSTMDCRPEVLAALCQACHNRLDAPSRRLHAAETRRLKKQRRGQLTLVGGEHE